MRATAAAADPSTTGFHLSALYSPVGWLSWARIARSWEAAQGSDEAIKAFRNTILGETWVESGEAPDWQRLYDRRERWKAGIVPAGGLFLTAGADVQKDRIEVDIWAWGRGLESWLVDHVVIEGGPDRHAAWGDLTALLDRSWAHEHGAHLRIARLAIDTGYEAPAVYAWSRRVGFAQVAPVKGVEGFNRSSPVSGPTFVDATVSGRRVRRGARLWTVAVSTFKAETYRHLRLDRPTDAERAGGAGYPPGTVHLPEWVEAEWLKQLVAEQLVTVKTRRGFTRLEWQKLRERNEALDCRVYARAAAWIAGLDRFQPRHWDALAASLRTGPIPEDRHDDPVTAAPPPRAAPARPRRVRSRGLSHGAGLLERRAVRQDVVSDLCRCFELRQATEALLGQPDVLALLTGLLCQATLCKQSLDQQLCLALLMIGNTVRMHVLDRCRVRRAELALLAQRPQEPEQQLGLVQAPHRRFLACGWANARQAQDRAGAGEDVAGETLLVHGDRKSARSQA